MANSEEWRKSYYQLKSCHSKRKYRVVVRGLSRDAGKPGSNPVEGSINKSVNKCVYTKLCSILYICVYSFVVLSCLFFDLKTTVVFCPDTPLANESLFQSANERSV